MISPDNWRRVLADVEVFGDSCNVYAVTGAEGTLFINAGTGSWLDTVPGRFQPPYSLLCTHYFRDHSAGAAEASQRGFDVLVPAGEALIFNDPVEHFRSRQSYIVYDNIWDTFVPITPIPATPVHDLETFDINGFKVTVVPLPGVTPNHSGFAVTTPASGCDVVFCGEAIHSRGRMARLAPLQYDYNDLGGAVNAYYSAGELRRRTPQALMPSLGEPILDGIDDALKALQRSLESLCSGRPLERELLKIVGDDRLERVTDHVWMEPHSEAASWYVISESGKALVIDYGYSGGFGLDTPTGMEKNWQWPSYPTRDRRRVLPHGFEPLKRQLGIDRIDVVLLSHFHDDHVAGVPMLRRRFGTECWVPENFASLLEHPEAHRFPCNWPEPLAIDRRLPLDREFTWEEFTFRLAPMSGHTRFSTAIAFEADGKRFAHTGDQHFFSGAKLSSSEGDWTSARPIHNEVYRNGARSDSYIRSAELLRAWWPDIILSGHQRPMYTDDTFFDLVTTWGEEFQMLHRSTMALGDDTPHFDIDSWGGWIWPYRIHVRDGETATVSVTVRNPLPTAAKLTVQLVGPDGWVGGSAEIDAPVRAESTVELWIRPIGPCRRQPIAAELVAGGMRFGQVADALVTVGGSAF